MASKKCSSCKVVKPKDCFNLNASKADGLATECKECRKEEYKKWYAKNREKALEKFSNKYKNDTEYRENYNEVRRLQRFELKLEVFKHYGGDPPKCACCGETHLEFLVIDHINGDGNKHRQKHFNGSGGHRVRLWLKQNNYPEGFRILCSNCNSSLGSYGYCPHGNLED